MIGQRVLGVALLAGYVLTAGSCASMAPPPPVPAEVRAAQERSVAVLRDMGISGTVLRNVKLADGTFAAIVFTRYHPATGGLDGYVLPGSVIETGRFKVVTPGEHYGTRWVTSDKLRVTDIGSRWSVRYKIEILDGGFLEVNDGYYILGNEVKVDGKPLGGQMDGEVILTE